MSPNALKFFIVLLVASTSVAKSNFDIIMEHCQVVLEAKSFCIFFDYKDDCFPWKTDTCETTSYTINERYCPRYVCPVNYCKLYYFYLQ